MERHKGIQHDVSINPGTPAARLINKDGQVIGINTLPCAIGNINGAVQVDYVREFLDSRGIAYKKAEASSTTTTPTATGGTTTTPATTPAPVADTPSTTTTSEKSSNLPLFLMIGGGVALVAIVLMLC